ncbi:hypothetical protein [Paraliobacillus sp. PM-2]|uniref:hypothetical protein n=1 Tax=Paraliobacillus sp. PM-2 TaxID=1462524 RepID=UPI000B85B695|nr:hypothetical protein [Paraliobacillus sp. PM-2]
MLSAGTASGPHDVGQLDVVTRRDVLILTSMLYQVDLQLVLFEAAEKLTPDGMFLSIRHNKYDH